MARKITAIVIVALWVALLGHEFLQTAGLTMDAAAQGLEKGTLTAFAVAVKAAEDGEERALSKLPVQAKVFDLLLIEAISGQWSREGSRPRTTDPKIYKLLQTFLI